MEQLNEILTEVSGMLWGWPMIILLLGTHLFLTIRLKCPQLHIIKAIKLSVQKDPDATGDVSQFGSLATALAATIGSGSGNSYCPGRSRGCAVVLADRCVRYLDEICRGFAGHQISCEDKEWQDARWSDVCP